MSTIKKSEWNDLISAINEIRKNPPDGCDPLSPIDLYDNAKGFPKSEVRRVRDALAATCPDISFPDLETPQLIKRSLLTEIQDALGQAWCDCAPPCDIDPETPFGLRDWFSELIIGDEAAATPGLHTIGNPFGFMFSQSGGDFLRDIIDGLDTTCPGRFYKLYYEWPSFGDFHKDLLLQGPTGGDGIIHYTGSIRIPTHYGIGRAHIDGIDEPTTEEQADLDAHPSLSLTMYIVPFF